MNFTVPLNLPVVLLPPLCFGALIAGVSLFVYMYIVYRKPLYGSILFAGILALIFVGSETLLLYVGSIRLNITTGRFFHITEQLSGVYYLTVLPFLLQQFLKVTPKWRVFNHYLIIISAVLSTIIFIAALVQPDLFISLTEHQPTWQTLQVNYARGKEGILYQIRDTLLGIYMIYSFICIIYDLRKREDREYVIYLGIAIFSGFLGALIDILYVYLEFYIDFISFNFSRFSLGITLLIAVMMAGTMKQFILSAKKLEIVHQKLVYSENRFRCLVNGTDDIVLTSDTNFNLISANTAALKQFGIEKEKLGEINIVELFDCSRNKDKVASQILKEKLDNFLASSSSLCIKGMLLDKYGEFAYEYNMIFEKVILDERMEIIIHASRTNVKVVSEYIVSESMCLVMNNQVLNVEEICSRLTVNLTKFMPVHKINTIKIGLREVIINAIEHGNLSISFEEKTKLTLSDQYVSHIINLQKKPEFRDKKVTIEYKLKTDSVEYCITDDGEGFNYREILAELNDKNDNDMLAHGRGLIMTLNIFDNVSFNEKGNSVTLIKNFGQV
ncbi:MAG: ATP-binding protein [Spirochaetes bacterium]|nr:ATP-binding protein [Spirochaetota bacterium]